MNEYYKLWYHASESKLIYVTGHSAQALYS